MLCTNFMCTFYLVIFSALGDYGYQMVTVGEVETKAVKESTVTSMIVSESTYSEVTTIGMSTSLTTYRSEADVISMTPSRFHGEPGIPPPTLSGSLFLV